MRKIEELKNKEIENMSIEELMFIIENDRTLTSLERIRYTTKLLSKM